MPEVGVLNLTIHDNSAEASEGLDQFTDALVRMREAIGSGLKLSGISKPLNDFNKRINDSKSLANVGTFLNALSGYTKAFKDADKIKFNAEPIKNLKDAIGDGLHLGQSGTQLTKLREALEGHWTTENASSAGNVLMAIAEGVKAMPSDTGTKATALMKMSSALEKYADAAERVKSVLGSSDDTFARYQESLNRATEAWESNGGQGIALNLQLFGRRKKNEANSEVASAVEDMQHFTETVHTANSAVAHLNVQLQETRDIVQSITVNPFAEMYQSFSQLAHEFDWFKKESLRLTSGSSPLLLGDGRTPGQLLLGDGSEPQTFLTVWKDTGEQWKQNWVFFASQAAEEMRAQFQPDWIWGGQPVAQSMSTFHLGAGASPLLLGSGGVAPENALSEWLDTSEQWKQDWIVGEGTVSDAVEEYARKFDGIVESLSEARAKAEAIREQQEASFYKEKPTLGMDQTNWMADNVTKLDLLRAQLKEAQAEYNKLVNEEGSGSSKAMKLGLEIQKLNDSIWEYTNALHEANEEQSRMSGFGSMLKGEWEGLRSGIGKLTKPIRDLVKRFAAIAKYRMLRSIIRHITSGFTEGVKNVYEYSKAIGGAFAPAMDSAATVIAQMKNSIGAALAPAIQAVIPYLNQLVNWFIEAVNWANQLFSLLGGQATWTRALPATVNAFDKQKKAAKGAGNAIKDLLADWDELNIIQKENTGGGSASAAEDYLKMFEEVGTFDNKIKDITGYIKEHMSDVLDIAKDIGIALLGWKFSSAFSGLLGKLASLIEVGLIVKLSADLTSFLDQLYIDTDNEMVAIADVILNTALAAVSGKLASAAFGAGVGEITAGLTLSVSAGATFSKAKEAAEIGEQAKSEVLAIVGAIKEAIAGVLVTAGLLAEGVALPLAIVGGVATIALATVISMSISYTTDKVQEAKAAAEEAFKKKSKGGLDPAEYISALQEKFDESTKNAHIVIDANVEYPELQKSLAGAIESINAMTDVVTGEGSISEEDAKAFKNAWDTVFDTLDRMSTTSFNTLLSGLNVALASAVGEAKAQLEDLRMSFIELEHNVSGKAAEMYKEMSDTINRILDNKYENEEDRKKDIERYQQLAESIQIMSDTSIDKLKESIERGKGIDFSQTGMEGLEDWLKEVSSASDEAKGAWKDSVASYEEALKFKRKEIEGLVHSGDITETEAESYYHILDDMVTSYKDYVNKKIAEIDSDKNTAFADAIASMFSGEITIDEWRHNVIPVLKKIKEYGGELPDWIYSYLKQGMEGNMYQGRWGLTDTFFEVAFSNADQYGSQRSAKEFVEDLNLRIEQILKQSGTEDFYRDISQMFGVDGVDLLSDEWKEKILKEAHKYGVSDSWIEELKKELGFDKEIEFDTEVKPRVRTQIPEKSEVEEKKPWWKMFSFRPLAEGEPRAEMPKWKNDNPMSWLDIFGIAFTPPETPVEVPANVQIDATVDIEDLYSDIRKQILESDLPNKTIQLGQLVDLYNHDDLETMVMLQNSIKENGIFQAFDYLRNFIEGEDWGVGGKNGLGIPSLKATNVPWIPPVGSTYLNGSETIKTEPADSGKEASNVETGVSRANKPIETLLSELITETKASNSRPINISLFPSSNFGFWGKTNEERAEAVTGG